MSSSDGSGGSGGSVGVAVVVVVVVVVAAVAGRSRNGCGHGVAVLVDAPLPRHACIFSMDACLCLEASESFRYMPCVI